MSLVVGQSDFSNPSCAEYDGTVNRDNESNYTIHTLDTAA